MQLHEKLRRVIVRYEGGRVDPLEFQWGTRHVQIRAVHARWADRTMRPIRYFFSVTTDSEEMFVLGHAEGDSLWYLESVMVS